MGNTVAALLLLTLPHPYDVQVTKTKKHRIYLTVDDHPTGKTRAVLAELRRCKLKATFFVLGTILWHYHRNPKWKPLQRLMKSFAQIKKDGHTLGNHGVTHRNLCKLKPKKVRWELRTTQRLVKKYAGVDMKWWRPPFLSICWKARKEAANLKLKLAWSHVDDLHGSAKVMWRRVRLRARRNKKYTILLFHRNVKKLKAFLKLSGLCP